MSQTASTEPGPPPATPEDARRARRRRRLLYLALVLGTAVATLVVAAVLVSIFEHKQEARTPFVRVVEVGEISTDPEPWGQNWPHQFEGYKATAGDRFYGGSSAMPASKLEQSPWLKRLYAGYAFSIDYREARGHAYMLYDQGVTERVTKRKQAGACIHCHASATVMWRKAGLEAMGKPADDAALAAGFDMPAVIEGFKAVSRKPYEEVLALVKAAPDGTPGENTPMFPEGDAPKAPTPDGVHNEAHPVGCIDCHDPKTMQSRVTRPGFVLGMAALAAGDAPVPHLPSVERWRRGDRERPYDPNLDATRQEMRSFVCGQCHVEYYCANKMVLTFPWGNGLKAEDLERYWDELKFPDGGDFYDYAHGETGAHVYKVQHPEFELWSQGIHAQSGVACADCHMPYVRQGATKMSSHNVRSPMENVAASCQNCHRVEEAELRGRVATIQQRTTALMERAAVAMTDMLDAILEAKAAGASDAQLARAFELQRKAMWRLDYISSENSKGFHADQEAARLLGESIDYSRQAIVEALRLRAPAAKPSDEAPREPVPGVTPTPSEPLPTPTPSAPSEPAPTEGDPT
ncbi:MAG: ammonia-forming cytochrome c nitrite reductase subunit c552, partial [Deltaproteobacteria bacterium]